jgi:hypothetical protein
LRRMHNNFISIEKVEARAEYGKQKIKENTD